MLCQRLNIDAILGQWMEVEFYLEVSWRKVGNISHEGRLLFKVEGTCFLKDVEPGHLP